MAQMVGLLAAAALVLVAGGLHTHALAAEGGPRQPPACATAALEDLKRLCPAPSDAVFSSECLAALDEHYARRPAYCDIKSTPSESRRSRGWWPVPRRDALVWADVFEGAVAMREKVEVAMRDPACRLRTREFDAGLRQPCAADAMARLAVLHRACRRPLATEDEANPYFHGWRQVWAERRAAIEEYAKEDYWPRIARLEESELHFAWRMAKCRAVPKPVLELLPMLRPPPFFTTPRAVDQHDLLMVAAARLGSSLALATAGIAIKAGHDAIAVEQWREAPLSLAYVSQGLLTGLHGLPYLLAARDEDLRSEMPWFDWRGFEQTFSAAESNAARPAAERIRAQGWPPCCKPQRMDSPWPWADLPTAVRRKFVRRRIDEEGNVRWVHRDGEEEWFKDGRTYIVEPDGEEIMLIGHTRIGVGTLRRWTDADGTERWVDEWGEEHWLEADGSEHWIELDGTEWILLPVGASFPADVP